VWEPTTLDHTAIPLLTEPATSEPAKASSPSRLPPTTPGYPLATLGISLDEAQISSVARYRRTR
jgi:hypothetical protein